MKSECFVFIFAHMSFAKVQLVQEGKKKKRKEKKRLFPLLGVFSHVF